MAGAITQVVSPYAYGPFYRNPLRDIVAKFDYDKVCAHSDPLFFVSATRVRNGKIRVFQGDEIGPEALLASACLPTLFQGGARCSTRRQDGSRRSGTAAIPAIRRCFLCSPAVCPMTS